METVKVEVESRAVGVRDMFWWKREDALLPPQNGTYRIIASDGRPTQWTNEQASILPIPEEYYIRDKMDGNLFWFTLSNGAREAYIPYGVFVRRFAGMIDYGYRDVPKSLFYKSSQATEGWYRRVAPTVAQLVEFNKKLLMKKPRKPQFYPLSLPLPKRPELRFFTGESLGQFVPKKGATPQAIAKAKAKWEANFSRTVERVNYIRGVIYRNKLSRYNEVVDRNARRVKEHRETFERRVRKYETRLQRYDELLRKSKLRGTKVLNFVPGKKVIPDNPFRSFNAVRLVEGGTPFRRLVTVHEDPWHRQIVVNEQPFFWKHGHYDESTVKSLSRDATAAIAAGAWSSFPELEAKVVSKIYDKLNRNQVHLGNLVAERVQTYKMILDAYKFLHDFISKKKGVLRKLKAIFSSPGRLLSTTADNILAFKFGVEPLANDLALALHRLVNDDGEVSGEVVVRANSKMVVANRYIGSCRFSGLVEISMVVKASVDNDFARKVSDLGLLDPSQILWEVTPWSFVADWFLPIGDWIQSLTSTQGLSVRTATKKIRLVGSFDFLSSLSDNQSYDGDLTEVSTNSGLGGVWSGELKDRQVFYDWPDRTQILRFKNPFSFWHNTEAAALLVQKAKLWRF